MCESFKNTNPFKIKLIQNKIKRSYEVNSFSLPNFLSIKK